MAVTMTRNYCIDLKRKKKFTFFDLNEQIEQHFASTPEKEFFNNEIYNLLHKAIDDLPENQKLAIQLKDIEGLSLDEIANIMQITNGNLRVLLSRARNKLKTLLKTKYKVEL